jgi:hypothetical protein
VTLSTTTTDVYVSTSVFHLLGKKNRCSAKRMLDQVSTVLVADEANELLERELRR